MIESGAERIFRRLAELGLDANLFMGGFFFATGLVLLVQLHYTSRRGYVVGYGSSRSYRINEPRSYRIRFALQVILGGVCVLGGLVFAASDFEF